MVRCAQRLDIVLVDLGCPRASDVYWLEAFPHRAKERQFIRHCIEPRQRLQLGSPKPFKLSRLSVVSAHSQRAVGMKVRACFKPGVGLVAICAFLLLWRCWHWLYFQFLCYSWAIRLDRCHSEAQPSRCIRAADEAALQWDTSGSRGWR